MKPDELFLRCYASQYGNQWQAFCVDLSLAAQGDTLQEAKQKLHNMIFEYVFDALEGEDQQYAHQLLNRKAPPMMIAKYHFLRVLQFFLRKIRRLGLIKDGFKNRLFNEVMPLGLKHCEH